jgi:hypothetical protein
MFILEVTGEVNDNTAEELDLFLEKVGDNITTLLLDLIFGIDGGESTGGSDEGEDAIVGGELNADEIQLSTEGDEDEREDIEDDETPDEEQEQDDDIGNVLKEVKVWKGRAEMWDWFPKLRVVGVCYEWFADMEGIPEGLGTMSPRPHGHALTIYISDMHFLEEEDIMRNTACNLMEWCKSHPRTVGRVAIQQSWKSLARQIIVMNGMRSRAPYYKSSIFASARAWFDEVEQAGIPFCDRNNVYSDSADASWFFNGLQNGFSDVTFYFNDA